MCYEYEVYTLCKITFPFWLVARQAARVCHNMYSMHALWRWSACMMYCVQDSISFLIICQTGSIGSARHAICRLWRWWIKSTLYEASLCPVEWLNLYICLLPKQESTVSFYKFRSPESLPCRKMHASFNCILPGCVCYSKEARDTFQVGSFLH